MRDGSSCRRVSPYLPLAVAGLLLSAGCDSGPAAPVKPTGVSVAKGAAEHHHHGEKGPRGGALVAIGDEIAHLEIVFDAETGKILAYVLDGEAHDPVRIKAEKLELTFVRGHAHEHDKAGKDKDDKDDDDVTGTVTLVAVEPAEDGTASVFSGTSELLKGADEFDAVIASIRFGVQEFTKVKFNYPEGNEHDHHH